MPTEEAYTPPDTWNWPIFDVHMFWGKISVSKTCDVSGLLISNISLYFYFFLLLSFRLKKFIKRVSHYIN